MNIIILHEKNRPQGAKILEPRGVSREVGKWYIWRISNEVKVDKS